MHIPFQPENWQGRVDSADGERGLRWHQVVKPSYGQEIQFLGLASDEGVRRNQGRVGAKDGPTALRKALANLPKHVLKSIGDMGDVVCEGETLEEAQALYTQMAKEQLSPEKLVIGLGGGHEIAFASASALTQAFPDSKIGFVNLDAHFDLRDEARASSGTPFLQALRDAPNAEYWVYGISQAANTQALFDAAERTQSHYRFDNELTLFHMPVALEELKRWIDSLDHLYLSLDMDVFSASYAPGVSAPAAYGLTPDIVEQLIRVAGQSGKLRIADIAELNPTYDIDNRTARLAARMIFTMVDSWANDKKPVEII
ncbi:MAG: formimidoylglutamase [Armatimonadetes bacterium]|nr:formimidoylglutamase [Armatimonadota bacterium]